MPTTLLGALVLLAALLVLPLVLASRAEAFVYWTNQTDGAIGLANLDGTGVDPRFIDGIRSPGSIALDAGHIYWTGGVDPEDEIPTIARARLDATHVDEALLSAGIFFLPNLPESIAVDENHVYWTEHFEDHPAGLMIPPHGSIGRVNLDGTDPDHKFIARSAKTLVTDVAVDGNHIYWSEYETGSGPTFTSAIGRANLDGTGVDSAFISSPSAAGFTPRQLEVDAGHLYWLNQRMSPYPPTVESIGRASLDGSGVEQSFLAAYGANSLAVDAGYLYWSHPTNIARANLDGTGIEQSFITTGSPVSWIDVNFSLGKLRRDKDKGTAKLTVEVPASGVIKLADTKKLKDAEVRAEAAGEVQLPIVPQGRAKRKLAHKGKAKVKVELTYTPDGGDPEAQTRTLKLIERG